MKKIIASLIIAASLVSCDENIGVRYVQVIPDSLKEKAAQFQIDLVKAATAHSYGEDPDSWINDAKDSAFDLYGVWVPAVKDEDLNRVPVK